MAILDSVLGNASEIDVAEVEKEAENLLCSGEKIEKVYKLIRDLFIFTNYRLILVDKQGLTGKKVEHHSIPYKSISHYSVESAGTFDLDAELKIYISSNPMPISKRFSKKLNIYDVQKVLSSYVLRK